MRIQQRKLSFTHREREQHSAKHGENDPGDQYAHAYSLGPRDELDDRFRLDVGRLGPFVGFTVSVHGDQHNTAKRLVRRWRERGFRWLRSKPPGHLWIAEYGIPRDLAEEVTAPAW